MRARTAAQAPRLHSSGPRLPEADQRSHDPPVCPPFGGPCSLANGRTLSATATWGRAAQHVRQHRRQQKLPLVTPRTRASSLTLTAYSPASVIAVSAASARISAVSPGRPGRRGRPGWRRGQPSAQYVAVLPAAGRPPETTELTADQYQALVSELPDGSYPRLTAPSDRAPRSTAAPDCRHGRRASPPVRMPTGLN